MIEFEFSLARLLGVVVKISGTIWLEDGEFISISDLCAILLLPERLHVTPPGMFCAFLILILIFSRNLQELRQNDVIDRLKAFTMIPPPGTVVEVSAGETQPLRLAYSADSLTYGGVHDLPVLVSTIAPATAESEPPTVMQLIVQKIGIHGIFLKSRRQLVCSLSCP